MLEEINLDIGVKSWFPESIVVKIDGPKANEEDQEIVKTGGP